MSGYLVATDSADMHRLYGSAAVAELEEGSAPCSHATRSVSVQYFGVLECHELTAESRL
jgi:hypothetical protein